MENRGSYLEESGLNWEEIEYYGDVVVRLFLEGNIKVFFVLEEVRGRESLFYRIRVVFYVGGIRVWLRRGVLGE